MLISLGVLTFLKEFKRKKIEVLYFSNSTHILYYKEWRVKRKTLQMPFVELKAFRVTKALAKLFGYLFWKSINI